MTAKRLISSTVKLLFISLWFLFSSLSISAKETNQLYFEKIADAIYWAEGGLKAKRPYGLILYPKSTKNFREVCLLHVRKYFDEWNRNPSGDFIPYLAEHWAPTKGVSPSTAKLNKNWLKNVRYYLNHPKPAS